MTDNSPTSQLPSHTVDITHLLPYYALCPTSRDVGIPTNGGDMAEEAKTAAEEVQFPLNQRLLEDTAKIKEERKIIKARINKIDASKGEVSDNVYNKVISDYTTQLTENTNQLLEKKQDIDRELSTLYEARKKVEGNVGTHREQLEEINFRHSLGEFDDAEFQKVADSENGKLGKFEKIMAAIDSNIKQYESLFEGEEDLGLEPPHPVQAETPPPPPPAGTAEPITEGPITVAPDEEYHVGDDDGYFAANTDEIPYEPEAEVAHETTSKDIPGPTPEEIAAAPKAAALASVKILEGEGKGQVIEIVEDEITIGRASSNAVVLKEAKVSRQHASIKRQGTEFLLEDLHSSNGVMVNDERVKEHALSDGDKIRIGDFVLKFSC